MERLCARIEKKVHDFFYSVGLFIADHPKRCLTFLSLWTVFMGVGVVRFNEVNNVRDHFSATTSPSRREYAIAREFYEELGSPFHVVVALRAADHGNILRPGHIEKALEIEDFLQYKLKVDHDNSTFSYSDFCGTQCETSDSVNIFLTMFRDSQVRKQTHVKLTYPTMDVFGHRVYLANNIFLVNINNRSNMIEGCGLIAINFHAIYNNTSTEEMMKKWERAVYEYSLKTENDPLIRIYVTSEGLVSEEVRRTGIQAMPLMSLSFVVMIMFTVTTTLKRNPVEAKPVEAVIGVFCPMLSIVASFGMLFWFGFDFLPIVTVVPFLVLAIGVDDVYIFMHAWHRSDHSLACRERMATALADAGPSISITSLTNLLSFAIGVTTTTPAIYTFCVYISVAVIYDYIYQIFFFSAVLVLSGHREAKNINGYCWWKTVPEKKALKGDSSVEDQLDRFSAFAAHFLDLYVDFLMTWWSKLLIGAIMIVYWAVMINGAMQIKVGLTSEKLFMDDSPLLELVRLQSNVIFKEGGQNRGSIAFKYRYLPEFFRNQEYRRWSHFVSMGSSQECMDEKPSCLRKFVFSTGFHNAVSEQGDAQSSPGFDELRKMKNKFLEEVTTFPKQVAWSERLRLLESWRRMAAEYTHLNLTVYEDFSMYSDQLLTIVPVTQQTVFFALICMIFILMLFTPSFYTICTSTAAVLSINIGVFGCLVYMHIDLDPISMTTTLMAIGFSVDFVAHITFHYYKGEYPSKRDRLRHALSSIAWPMIQAGTSTMAGIAVLIVIHAYMVQVFVKVVVLVISLGMVHGLLILPVVFAALPFKKMSTEEVAVAKNQEQSAIQSRTEVAIPLKGAEKNRKSAKA